MTAVTLVAIACIVAQAQPPRDTRRAPRALTGSIRGVVSSSEPRPRPLRRARVTITGPTLEIGRSVITADDGTFAFEGLPAGRYSVSAAKEAYVGMNHGAFRPYRPGTPVVLKPGATETLAFRLARGAVITGVVTDFDGLPAQGVNVTALAPRLIALAGERRLVNAMGAMPSTTDERGIYRIYGLAAGEYVIGAQVAQRMVAPGGPEMRTMSQGGIGQRAVTMTPVYYPGATDVSAATRVSVAAGEERSGIDVHLQYVPVATVSGSTPVSAGINPAFVSLVRLGDSVGGGEAWRTTRAEPDGRFTLSSVPPGRYALIARGAGASAATGASAPAGPAPLQWSSAEVVVEGEDVLNVALSTLTPITIAGRLVFEGSRPPPDVTGLRMPLLSAAQMIAGLPVPLPPVRLEAGGRFVIAGVVPGVYRLGAMSSQPTPGIRAAVGPWWLQSVEIDGRDILDAPLDLRQGTDAAIVRFSDQASELSGTVHDPHGAAVPDVFVVAFGADRGSWFFNSRRVAGVRPDAQGRYSFRNLPPGEYRVIATADVEPNEWFDAPVLDRFLGAAASITIAGVERKSVDLAIR